MRAILLFVIFLVVTPKNSLQSLPDHPEPETKSDLSSKPDSDFKITESSNSNSNSTSQLELVEKVEEAGEKKELEKVKSEKYEDAKKGEDGGANKEDGDAVDLTRIYKLLEGIDLNYQYKDLVLFLGMDSSSVKLGSGKNSVLQLIARDPSQLISQKIGGNPDKFQIQKVQIEDQNASSEVTSVLQYFPELFVHPQSNIAYYDYPEFPNYSLTAKSNNSTVKQLVGDFFAKKSLDSASRVKIIFVISADSLFDEENQARDFLILTKNSMKLVKDLQKFKAGTALVVTNTPNVQSSNSTQNETKIDEAMMQSVAESLQKIKRKISELGETDLTLELNAVKLIDTFLMKSRSAEPVEYLRIGIFRQPNEAGNLTEIPELLQAKQNLEEIVKRKTHFVAKETGDFRNIISLSEKSGKHVKNFNDETTEIIISLLSNFSTAFQKEILGEFQILPVNMKAKEGLEILIGDLKKQREKLGKLFFDELPYISTPHEFLNEMIKFFQAPLHIEDENSGTSSPSEEENSSQVPLQLQFWNYMVRLEGGDLFLKRRAQWLTPLTDLDTFMNQQIKIAQQIIDRKFKF